MEFKKVKWPCDSGISQVVVQVSFDRSDIQRAQHIAAQKMLYIDVHSPGGMERAPEIIRNRIVAGKLADAAVLELITLSIQKRKSTWRIEEYDETRNDGFEFPDQYDLLVVDDHGDKFEIEVRSSFAYRLIPEEKIVKKLSVYGWYTSVNKAAEKHHNWYWQVIYHMRPQDIEPEEGWPPVVVFEDCLEAGEVTAFIVGGASKLMLEDNALASNRYDQDNAQYRSIYPICKSFDCKQMIVEMLGSYTS